MESKDTHLQKSHTTFKRARATPLRPLETLDYCGQILVEHKMVIDFSTQSVLRKFELIVEGRSLFINAHYLAELSPYFEKICFAEGFREASEHRVVIDDETYEDVVEFLTFICPTEEHTYQRDVTAENFAVLAHFCHRMQFPSVLRQLKDFLETDHIDKRCINENSLVEIAVEVLVDGLFGPELLHRVCRRLANFGVDRIKELTKELPPEYGSVINEEVERATPQTLQQRAIPYHWNDTFSQRMFF
uniref:BTB domain-containing protein n=1 Tax=Steinernema glaseri TaxID=37863 RepID=A0A1I7YHH4_9BILA